MANRPERIGVYPGTFDPITLGHADIILAGGVESLSNVPILHSRRLSALLVEASKARSLGARLKVLSRIRPRDLVPVSPAIAEPSTGETMGQSAEKMAKENHISREAQDRVALMSHQRAAAATADGRMTAEITPWFGGRGMDEPVTTDNGEYQRVTGLEIDDFSRERMNITLQELLEERDGIKHLLG